VNAETNMKPILLTVALLVLTGAAGSAPIIRSTAALGDPRDAAWFSPGEAFAPCL
jgi:hypothetical protein